MESILSVGFFRVAAKRLLLVLQRRIFLNYKEYDSEKIHVPVHKHIKYRKYRFIMKEFVAREQLARRLVRGPVRRPIPLPTQLPGKHTRSAVYASTLGI